MKITINIDGKKSMVDKENYIRAKTKDLKEFGYSTLTEDEVGVQLEKVIKGEPLSVIGLFIKDDIVIG